MRGTEAAKGSHKLKAKPKAPAALSVTETLCSNFPPGERDAGSLICSFRSVSNKRAKITLTDKVLPTGALAVKEKRKGFCRREGLGMGQKSYHCKNFSDLGN